MDDLLLAIDFECFDNIDLYLPYIGEDQNLLFYQSLHDYIVFKYYNSDFVDLIPFICANALNICINIVAECNGNFLFYRVHPTIGYGTNEIFVTKTGEHYDSLIHTSTSNDFSLEPCGSDGSLGELSPPDDSLSSDLIMDLSSDSPLNRVLNEKCPINSQDCDSPDSPIKNPLLYWNL